MKPLKIVPFDHVVGEVLAAGLVVICVVIVVGILVDVDAVALAVVVVVVAKNRFEIRIRRFWPKRGLNLSTLGELLPLGEGVTKETI